MKTNRNLLALSLVLLCSCAVVEAKGKKKKQPVVTEAIVTEPAVVTPEVVETPAQPEAEQAPVVAAEAAVVVAPEAVAAAVDVEVAAQPETELIAEGVAVVTETTVEVAPETVEADLPVFGPQTREEAEQVFYGPMTQAEHEAYVAAHPSMARRAVNGLKAVKNKTVSGAKATLEAAKHPVETAKTAGQKIKAAGQAVAQKSKDGYAKGKELVEAHPTLVKAALAVTTAAVVAETARRVYMNRYSNSELATLSLEDGTVLNALIIVPVSTSDRNGHAVEQGNIAFYGNGEFRLDNPDIQDMIDDATPAGQQLNIRLRVANPNYRLAVKRVENGLYVALVNRNSNIIAKDTTIVANADEKTADRMSRSLLKIAELASAQPVVAEQPAVAQPAPAPAAN